MRKIINRVLTVLLILTITVIGGGTIAKNAKSLAYAGLVTYTTYQTGEGLFENIKARIKALTTALNVSLIGKDAFEKANAKLQLSLGKQMLNFGGTTMVKLKTGQLYDVQADTDVHDDVARMKALHDKLSAQGIPMVFAYAHSELYEDDLLPSGVEDFNNKVADDIVTGLRAEGIDTIDSREVVRDAGLTLDEAVYRTDQHWSILTAFDVYAQAVKRLNATGKIALDERAADKENFHMEVLPGAHMGDVGARIGAELVAPDDFQLITPAFDTKIHQKIMTASGFQERDGSFEAAVMNCEILEGDGAKNRYDAYGHHTEVVYYTNETAPAGRLLIVKDSFGTPISSFMSLAVRDVCAIDLRKGRTTIEEAVAQFKPDAVLIVHCQEMMRGKNYVFVD
ncbi:MAG: hypothetical protein RR296_11215 [Clostridia bacterium]